MRKNNGHSEMTHPVLNLPGAKMQRGQIDRQVDGTAREAVGVRFFRTVAKSGSQRAANRERTWTGPPFVGRYKKQGL